MPPIKNGVEAEFLVHIAYESEALRIRKSASLKELQDIEMIGIRFGADNFYTQSAKIGQ